jgi:stalled ribosome alternative rescue factor ArfA
VGEGLRRQGKEKKKKKKGSINRDSFTGEGK